MAHSHLSALRPLRAKDLDPLLTELNAISRQAEDIQHRIAVLQAGGPLLRPGWPMRRLTSAAPEDLTEGADPAPEDPLCDEDPPPEQVACDEPPFPEEEVEDTPASPFPQAEPAFVEDPLALILRIAGDLEEISHRDATPSAAELQIRAIRDRIARSAAFSPAYLPEASASI